MSYKLFERPLSAKDFATPEAREEVFKILNYTASGQRFEAQAKKLQAQIEAFGTVGDFETSIHEVIKKFQALPVFDTGYEQVFDMIDATQTNDDGFTIYDVTDTLTFSKVPVGQKAKVYSMSGTKAEVGYDLYGAGLGWHRTLFEDRKFWQVENNAKVFINKYNYTKASAFYALIEAAGAVAGQEVTWQTHPDGVASGTAGYLAGRDAATLNAAALKIFTAIKDKGYSAGINTPLKVVCPFALVGRLNNALKYVLQGFDGSPNQVSYTFQLVPTMLLSSVTRYYVCLPKEKLVGGNRKNLEIYPQWDPASYSDFAYGWGRYGGAVGDSEQVVRCLIS